MLAAVLDYFREGRSVCPFAAPALRAETVRFAALTSLDDDATVSELVCGFGYHHSAAILVAPPLVCLGHAAAEQLAGEVFGVLALACYRQAHPTVQIADRAAVIADCRTALADPVLHVGLELRVRRHPRRPPGPRLERLFTIAMGPAYHPKHPRFAPALCVVLTWQRDVQRAMASEPRACRKIRSAMMAATGAVYDAVTFYLPETAR